MDIEWKNLRAVLKQYGEVFIENAKERLAQNNSNATYTLSDSMKLSSVEITDDYFSVTIEIEDYWKYVEEGRGPGKYPPVEKIEEWVERKPVQPQSINGDTPSVKQLSFLIARKIAERGTTPNPFFEITKEETWKQMEESIYEAIQEDIAEHLESIIGNIK